MTQFKPRSGFTIIEVVVAAGLFSILGLIVASFFTEAGMRSLHLTQNLDLTLTSVEVGQIFSNQDSCNTALLGQNIADITADTNVIQVNHPSSLNPSLFQTQQVALGIVVSKSQARFDVLDSINHIYLMTLTVEFQKPAVPDVTFRPRRFYVPVSLSPPVGTTSAILGCLQGTNPAIADDISCQIPGTYMHQLDADLNEQCTTP